MKAEKILDLLVLYQGLWPHVPFSEEQAKRWAGHFSKMDHRKTRDAIERLADLNRFPPTFGEVTQKIRDLELAGHYRIKAQGRKRVNRADEENRQQQIQSLRYARDSGKISLEEFQRRMKELDSAKLIGDVLPNVLGGIFEDYAALGRRLFKGEIDQETYEREREKLDAKRKA